PGRSRQDAPGLRTSLAARASRNTTDAREQDGRDDEGRDEESAPEEKEVGDNSNERNQQEEEGKKRLPLPAIESPPRCVRMSGPRRHGAARRTNRIIIVDSRNHIPRISTQYDRDPPEPGRNQNVS